MIMMMKDDENYDNMKIMMTMMAITKKMMIMRMMVGMMMIPI